MSAGILTKLLGRLGRGKQPRNTLSGTRELPPGGSYEALEALDEQAILMFGKRFEELDEVTKKEVMEEVMETMRNAEDKYYPLGGGDEPGFGGENFNQGGRVGLDNGGTTIPPTTPPTYQEVY